MRPAFAGRGPLLTVLALAWLASAGVCRSETAPRGPAPAGFGELLVDATAELGLDFVHWNGMTGRRYINEVLGGGGVLFDYDRDGDLDLFAVQGHLLAGGDGAEPVFPPPEPSPRDRLFRNDLPRSDPSGNGPSGNSPAGAGPRFRDVTATSRIDARGYGMGAVAADVDGDGWPDLYVLNWGANQLWRNRGDGTFEDVTAKAGVGDERWSTAATFFDFDLDGDLDLFVGNYLDFDPSRHKTCFAASGVPDYCGPASYDGAADRLYRNRGDGTFEDVTASLGLAGPRAAGLGSLSLDVDGDGRLELFVANDGMANHLWSFDGRRFEETALLAGCAVNGDGLAEASMGVDIGDIDGDGDEDLFMTHLDQETNTLYLNEGGFFEDASDAVGDVLASFAFTGFGTRLVDLDLDGWLDAVVVNGSVKALEALVRAGDPYPLHQRNHVYRNVGGRLVEVTASLGRAFEPSHTSRGLSVGDLDNDGDADLVIFNNNGPLRVLLNRVSAPFIGLDLRDGKSEAIGARVGVQAGDRMLWRRVQSGGSYASGQDPRIVVGLGGVSKPASRVERVRVEWLGGAVEEWRGLEAGRYHRLARGAGQAPAESRDD